MALTELVSNLSAGIWNPEASPQGSTPAQSPFAMPIGPGSSNTPNNAIQAAPSSTGQSLFLENTTANAGTFIRFRPGFNNLGFFNLSPGYRESKDDYPVPQGGISKRMNQGGIGFPFPKGPTGNVYNWKPEAHTGWNINNKYNDSIGAIYGNSGLADTYTTNSPIDDIYNKVKVRSEAWNRNSFGLATDQPFILRGIQRDNNSEPQYWGGFADTISSTPRGGISAFVERDTVDKVRIRKFLLSPKGLAYSAKQFGLQVMNPNVESFLGVPIPAPAPLTNKFYNPLSPLNQNPILGVRARRDTILPVDIGYRYGDIFTTRNVTGFGTRFNRLNLLTQETFGLIGTATGAAIGIAPGMPFLTLTSVTGPKSVFGAGITPISRYTNTSLSQYNLLGPNTRKGLAFIGNPLLGNSDPKKRTTGLSGIAYNAARYTDLKPYLGSVPSYDPGSDDSIWASPVNPLGNAKILKIVKDLGGSFLKSKLDRQKLLLKKWEDTSIGAYKPFELYTDTLNYLHQSTGRDYIPGEYDDEWSEEHQVVRRAAILQDVQVGTFDGGGTAKDVSVDKAKYATLAYGKLPDNLASNYNDFRIDVSDTNTKTFISNSPEKYATRNINTRLGMPNYADPTLDRSDPKKAAVRSGDTSITNDLVKFQMNMSGLGNLRFRAYIKSISNSWNVNSENGTRFGMAQVVKEKKYVGLDHQISVDFSVPILSKIELRSALNRLNALAKTFYGVPDPRDESTRTMVLVDKLVIGKYLKINCYITSISYDIDNETTWDIDNETPMLVNVSMAFQEAPSDRSATSPDKIIYHP